ncbi:hypothetical protein ACFE04_006559 [Oxalis oulophora]
MDEERGPDQIQFHRNEAISAVADDGFLGEEEEDEDYEDLYNDVNVGEGFAQYQRKTDDAVVAASAASGEFITPNQNDTVADNNTNNNNNKLVVLTSSSNVSNPVQSDFKDNLGLRGPVGGTVGSVSGDGGVIKVELGQGSGNVNKSNEIEQQNHNIGIGNNNNNTNNNNHNNNSSSSLVAVQGQRLQSSVAPSQGSVVTVINTNGGVGNGGIPGGGGGGTILFVGDLHWWTTDAELEAELVKYGAVKEIKFFDEKASGKSKGYCQVEFYDPAVATACKDGMNGHVFNGRPCVVAFASPHTIKRMGEAHVSSRNQQQAPLQARRGQNDVPGKNLGGNNNNNNNLSNYQGGDNRGFGRGNWGRGMGGRGPVGPRGRGPGGRGFMGNGFGQGTPFMHPQSMMGQGFDPAFGNPMGQMGYGGFPGAPNPSFSGVLPSFPPVAPHVNPAFFGRGMPMNSMGMMGASGVDTQNMGMWSDPSYNEDAASDHQYDEISHNNRGGWQNQNQNQIPMKEKDRAYERDMASPSERDIGRGRSRDRDRDTRERSRDRDRERDRDKYREDRDNKYADHHHRYKERDMEHGDDSRTRNKSRITQEEDHHRSRSRDADYGKRRRLTSE